MRRRSLSTLVALTLASSVAFSLLCSSPEVRAWSAGIRVVPGLPKPPNHHGDLAQRAVRCMDGGKGAPPGHQPRRRSGIPHRAGSPGRPGAGLRSEHRGRFQ